LGSVPAEALMHTRTVAAAKVRQVGLVYDSSRHCPSPKCAHRYRVIIYTERRAFLTGVEKYWKTVLAI